MTDDEADEIDRKRGWRISPDRGDTPTSAKAARVTDEQLHAVCDTFEVYPSLSAKARRGFERDLRRALASIAPDAKPYGWIVPHKDTGCESISFNKREAAKYGWRPLYDHAAPLPAAAPDAEPVAPQPLHWLDIAQRGYDTWAAKPHNAKWVRKIDGTPIPNDLPLCIGQAFADALAAPLPANDAARVPGMCKAPEPCDCACCTPYTEFRP